MYIAKMRIPDRTGIAAVHEIARGDVLLLRQAADQASFEAVAVLDDAKIGQLRDRGFVVEIIVDKSRGPDPREEVSRENRYEEKLNRLRARSGGR